MPPCLGISQTRSSILRSSIVIRRRSLPPPTARSRRRRHEARAADAQAHVARVLELLVLRCRHGVSIVQEDSNMRITILDPTATPPAAAAHDEPAAGPLAGKTVGIRLDRAWRSFEWVSDEWASAFRARGASVTSW